MSSLSWNLHQLVARLVKLMTLLLPRSHVGPEGEGSTLSRIRGNLALFFTAVVELQSKDNAEPAVRKLDLSELVPVCIDMMRKERGKVQNNIGVCVTRFARSQRYI